MLQIKKQFSGKTFSYKYNLQIGYCVFFTEKYLKGSKHDLNIAKGVINFINGLTFISQEQLEILG